MKTQRRGRRWSALVWLVLGLTLILAPPLLSEQRGTAGSAATRPAALAQRVARVGMTVGDMDRSVDFFSRVLDFDKVEDEEVAGPEYERLTGVFGVRCRIVRMRLGGEEIELTEYLAPAGRAIQSGSRSNDRWFQHIAIITSNMDAAYARLRKNKVKHASAGPQTLPDWNVNAGGIKAFYFHDPDGHVLEVLQFPSGKGEQRWQEKGRLFLGIDHTAIVVEDTDKSLRFYRDALGMEVVGTSENWGQEQERLNNVFGARLRITTLAARNEGVRVELLEYLTPRDGKPYPADARANDLVHWQTTVEVGDVPAAAARLRAGRARAVSADVAMTPQSAFMVRDPDGHAVMLRAE